MSGESMSDEKKPAGDLSPPLPATPASYVTRVSNASAKPAERVPPANNDEGDTAQPMEFGTSQLKEIIGALQGELDKKSAEAAENHDLYVRSVAEMENVRRRLEKDKEETAKYAISKFAKDILSVGDNFQRAIAAVPQGAADADPALKSLLDGVVLAEREFRTALERHGVKTIEPAGQPFNPHHHQAVMEREDLSVPTGTVLQVFQAGYLIDDRCLRPAMVVVSRGGPKPGTNGNKT
jgi:molecular chaperone GrpE